LLKRALSWPIALDSRQQSCIILELSDTGSRKVYQRRAPIVQLVVLSEKDREGNPLTPKKGLVATIEHFLLKAK
jgi:hypothetical protein